MTSNTPIHTAIDHELTTRGKRDQGILLIATYGRPFERFNRPKGVRLRAAKQCYRNAGNFVLEHTEDFLYCEGLAVSANGLHCVPHAWVSPVGTSQAVDVTWKLPGVAYFGIALAEPALVRLMNRTMTYGPFADIIDPLELSI